MIAGTRQFIEGCVKRGSLVEPDAADGWHVAPKTGCRIRMVGQAHWAIQAAEELQRQCDAGLHGTDPDLDDPYPQD